MYLQVAGMVLGLASSLLLLVGCAIMIFPKRRRKSNTVLAYLSALFIIEGSCNVHAILFGTQNLYLFSISSYLHFAFLSVIYFKNLLNVPLRVYLPIIAIGILPLLWGLHFQSTAVGFQSFDRSFYSFSIMIYALYYWYWLIKKERLQRNSQFHFNVAVIAFFSMDAFLAVGANFLVNESLILVAGFWIVRALLLLFYYWSVIKHSWKIGQTPQRLSYGL